MKKIIMMTFIFSLQTTIFAQYIPFTKDDLKEIHAKLPFKTFLGMGKLTLKDKTAADVVGDKEFYFETKTPAQGAVDQIPAYWIQDGTVKKYSIVLYPVALKKGVEYRYGVIVDTEASMSGRHTCIIQNTKIARSKDLLRVDCNKLLHFDEETFNAMNTTNK